MHAGAHALVQCETSKERTRETRAGHCHGLLALSSQNGGVAQEHQGAGKGVHQDPILVPGRTGGEPAVTEAGVCKGTWRHAAICTAVHLYLD